MASIDPAAINRALEQLFSNGTGEAGLEVGTDPGLPASEHIRIPASMRKNWCARLTKPGAEVEVAQYTAPPSSMVGKPGWVTSGRLLVHDGSLWTADAEGDMTEEVDEFHIDAPTFDDVRRFVAVNVSHIREESIPAESVSWVHAVRFWAVAAGFVVNAKAKEFVEVPDPAQIPAGVDDIAAYIVDFAANAWTAAAARTASWKKTNHATGGDIVQGFPARWLNKMGFVRSNPDRNAERQAMRSLTDAFYVATHAISVHSVLALMVPDETHHWADVDPAYGLIPRWDIGRSAKIRLEPKTQIAGAAIVVDSVVVLRMAIREGIAPLIMAIDQVDALLSAYRVVEDGGMRCATYAKWFFEGHPDEDEAACKPIAFDQKSSDFAELAGELATIGTRYYAGSTIAGSAALRNAAAQLCPEDVKSTWATVAANRQRVSGQQVIAMIQAIKGNASAGAVGKILDTAPEVVREGVTAYNAALADLAAKASVGATTALDVDRILIARGAAPTAAQAAT